MEKGAKERESWKMDGKSMAAISAGWLATQLGR